MTVADLAMIASELDVLLDEATRRGFRWQRFLISPTAPQILAGVLDWPGGADVCVLRDADHAHAYRMPTTPDCDVFAPHDVYWWYSAGPVWTLRSLLTLPEPGHPPLPSLLAPAPPGSGIPRTRTPVPPGSPRCFDWF